MTILCLMSRRERCAVDTNLCPSVTGDVMNNFLNENFQSIVEDVGQPSYRAIGMIVHQIVTALAEKNAL
jgi:hypothetical protein